MKIAVEYMKHLIDGVEVDPEWIISGEHFPDTDNNTYIGVVLSKDVRNYYIPSTLKVMTKNSIQSRNLGISHPDRLADNDELIEAHNIAKDWVATNIQ